MDPTRVMCTAMGDSEAEDGKKDSNVGVEAALGEEVHS